MGLPSVARRPRRSAGPRRGAAVGAGRPPFVSPPPADPKSAGERGCPPHAATRRRSAEEERERGRGPRVGRLRRAFIGAPPGRPRRGIGPRTRPRDAPARGTVPLPPTGSVDAEHHVVDQARRPEPDRQREERRAVDAVELREGAVVGAGDVLHVGPRLRREDRADRGRGARRASRSPAAQRARPARSARWRTAAAARSSGERWTLRELIARPSGSRTVGQATTSVPIARSRAIRAMTRSCWASFSPK